MGMNTKTNFMVMLLLAVAVPIVAGTRAGAAAPPDVELLHPFAPDEVVLTDSWVTEREQLNLAFLKLLEPDRLLHNFRVTAGLPSQAQPLQGWEAPGVGLRGHFVGHWLSAAACWLGRNDDPLLRQRLATVVEGLRECQQAHGNGYLSAFPESDFDVLEERFSGVWAPYYTFHKIMKGLLDVYVHTGNRKAFDMVEDMAGYAGQRMAKLTPERIARMLYTVEANPSNEAGGMNEVLYALYRISGEPRHLELARLFDPAWFLQPLTEGEDILSGLHANTHIILVNGFAEAYAATGEERYRRAVDNFWDILMRDHAYANGTSSGPRPNVVTETSLTAEHWGEPGHLCNTLTRGIGESCVTHNTQRLNASLFSWTGEPRYADAAMNMFYNAVLPVQSPSTGGFVYHLPLGSPRHKAYMRPDEFKCCSGSCLEAFTRLNSGIYYHTDTALYVTLYLPSQLDWREKGLRLRQWGNFPLQPEVGFSLSLRKATALSLNLFVPSWAEDATVYVNGERQDVQALPSSFVRLSREWNDGDSVRLAFRYGFRLKSMPDKENMFAVFYGPMMLAFESGTEVILKGDKAQVLEGLSVAEEGSGRFVLRNGGQVHRLRPFFDVDGESYGVYATIRNY